MPLFSKFVVALTVVGRAAAFGRIGARAGALRVRSGGDTRLHSAVATAGTPTKLVSDALSRSQLRQLKMQKMAPKK